MENGGEGRTGVLASYFLGFICLCFVALYFVILKKQQTIFINKTRQINGEMNGEKILIFLCIKSIGVGVEIYIYKIIKLVGSVRTSVLWAHIRLCHRHTTDRLFQPAVFSIHRHFSFLPQLVGRFKWSKQFFGFFFHPYLNAPK